MSKNTEITNLVEFIEWAQQSTLEDKVILDEKTEFNVFFEEYSHNKQLNKNWEELYRQKNGILKQLEVVNLLLEIQNLDSSRTSIKYINLMKNFATQKRKLNEFEDLKRQVEKHNLLTKEKIENYFKDEKSKSIKRFFRGYSNSIWKLEPILFRHNYLEHEHDIYKQALRDYPKEFNHNSVLDNLVHMQHYGLPTRLLDITSNPLVALYFATDPTVDADGKVFMVLEDTSSDIEIQNNLEILAQLVNIECNHKLETNILFHELYKKTNINTPYSEINLNHFKEEKLLFSANKINSRIIAQAGEFYLFGNLDPSNKKQKCPCAGTLKDDISIIIPKQHKKDIREKLDLLNINQPFLFPDLDSYGKYIKNKYK